TDRAPGRVRGPLGDQSLADACLHLEAIRIIEPDESMGCLENGRTRAVIPAEDDRSRIAMPFAEAQDVADRRSPEAVDRLIVVADDGQVAMSLGNDRDELRLGAVRVLELVDEDVPEAPL